MGSYFPGPDVIAQGCHTILQWLKDRNGHNPTIERDSTFYTAEAKVVAKVPA